MAKLSLKDKTTKGVAWSTEDAFLSHGVTFIVGLAIACLVLKSIVQQVLYHF